MNQLMKNKKGVILGVAIKETVEELVGNPDLEAEGKAENFDGNIQEKIGEIKDVVGK